MSTPHPVLTAALHERSVDDIYEALRQQESRRSMEKWAEKMRKPATHES